MYHNTEKYFMSNQIHSKVVVDEPLEVLTPVYVVEISCESGNLIILVYKLTNYRIELRKYKVDRTESVSRQPDMRSKQ